MKINKLSPSVIFAFTILVVLSLFSSSTLATIGTPHIVYGKVFTSSRIPPQEANLEIYSYIPARPGEILDKSSVGCGYDIFFDGWLWFEAGNFITPWSNNETLRIIAIDNLSKETGALDISLNTLGNQLLSDINLKYGDNIGPIASDSMANGASSASIPEGTSSITVTATIDDSICGNNNIQKAEYFVDTDPGLGSGTIMNPKDGFFNSPQEEVAASVNTSTWTQGSTHTIYVRGQDVYGNWGTTHAVIVSVTKPEKNKGDLDGDGDVDVVDIMMVASRWNNRVGDPNYDAKYDLDSDGDIDIVDIMKVAAQWGWTA